eukprot:gnl/TRDRNA2_/TRDRNA2_81940_c0_seq1.p1 gnl/TRDRNA2_/TRDRNA2_81940_c0~~gnl/TRDRNA2_/TRDRNA2_81940_c0_seq1.p1  ORF type:complete len:113 (+),score=1.51 gnl/TRDRNA2_/TRDRNA2_81940_c0_seq1:32-340(+)
MARPPPFLGARPARALQHPSPPFLGALPVRELQHPSRLHRLPPTEMSPLQGRRAGVEADFAGCAPMESRPSSKPGRPAGECRQTCPGRHLGAPRQLDGATCI